MDETASIVLDRPQKPLQARSGSKRVTAIAFAASSPLDSPGYVWLYYSIADRKPYRARLRIAGAIADSALRETTDARER